MNKQYSQLIGRVTQARPANQPIEKTLSYKYLFLIIFIHAIPASPTNYHTYPCRRLVKKRKHSAWQSTCLLAEIHAEIKWL